MYMHMYMYMYMCVCVCVCVSKAVSHKQSIKSQIIPDAKGQTVYEHYKRQYECVFLVI